MTEEEVGFDPTMKKKKKKKKPFDPSAIEGIEDGPPTTPSGAADDDVEKGDKDAASKENIDDDENLDFTKLKRKKKKPTFNLEDLGGALDDSQNAKDGIGADGVGGDDDLDFNNMKKKKKKKKVNVDEFELDEEAEGEVDSPSSGGTDAWRGSDRDYTYDELLQRVFNIMKEKNPDMVAGEKRKFVMKPPQVLRVGTKKTSFANFLEISKTLRRTSKHLQAFLLAELGTSGSVDANNQLIIKGRFQQKQIENILRRYIKEYVTCHTCRAPETILEKDTRLNFLRCEKCGSRCSVQSIKSGFQAVTAKRAAIRAKAT
ncbi:eukaryotic translation initiation factor 2 subunit 2 [Galendromus occidentalis]|uniref:Eukaryotic translation initiation factor 2 subunit 2 n=1 Tax=Galendromus occidentalis TaxID=34638 RepID=A0AAJ6VVY1_9ACAR|nr:eukaryotic translation initiation factor 2 subunit 2 [Galendromus occidentalis]